MDEIDQRIIKALSAGACDDIVILFIPSHDRKNVELPTGAQHEWAIAGLELVSDLYGGGTAFTTFRGVYRSQETGEDLWDNPILIETFVERERMKDPTRLRTLADFLRRMKEDLRQEAVMVVVNDTRHFV